MAVRLTEEKNWETYPDGDEEHEQELAHQAEICLRGLLEIYQRSDEKKARYQENRIYIALDELKRAVTE